MHEPRHAVSKTVEMSSTESMAVYCACVAVQRNSCALMKQKYSLMDVARYACSYRSPCHSMALRPCLLRRPYKAHRTNDHGIAQRPLDQVASMSTSDATAAVHELVLAMQEALLCGARATDTDATGALTEMHNRSLHAEQCIHNIKDAMMNSLSSAADVGAVSSCRVDALICAAESALCHISSTAAIIH